MWLSRRASPTTVAYHRPRSGCCRANSNNHFVRSANVGSALLSGKAFRISLRLAKGKLGRVLAHLGKPTDPANFCGASAQRTAGRIPSLILLAFAVRSKPVEPSCQNRRRLRPSEVRRRPRAFVPSLLCRSPLTTHVAIPSQPPKDERRVCKARVETSMRQCRVRIAYRVWQE